MMPELIILSVVLALSVVAHFFFWRDSKRRYTDYMKHAYALRERIEELEESNVEMDRMLDEAEGKMEKIDEGIEDLRSGKYITRKMTTFDN